jgi:phosphinothricin acetyltransferase
MEQSDISFRSMNKEDWSQVAAIYKEGIESGNATFEQEVPSYEEWDKKHLQDCRIVAESNNSIMGWAALLPVSTRQCYSGVAEVSVYVASDYRSQKVGKQLLSALIECSEDKGIWTLQASIFPENKASIHSLKQSGFRLVGERNKIGKMNGEWRDTVLLERRSEVAGK